MRAFACVRYVLIEVDTFSSLCHSRTRFSMP